MESVIQRDLAHHKPASADVVRCRHGVLQLEIYLMLARRDLMMRCLHLEPHPLESADHVATRLFRPVHRREIKIPANVVRDAGGLAVSAPKEKKELDLGANQIVESHLLRPPDHIPERGSRT